MVVCCRSDVCYVFYQAEDGIRDLVRSRGLGDVYKRQARANAEIAEWAPARAAMEEALRLDPQAPKSVPGLHGLCASIDEGVGDLPAALHCLQQERFVKDSLTSAGIAERMTRIQAMYAVRAKDKAVEELHELNRALTLQLADKRTTTRWALMACAGLSVGMLCLLYTSPSPRDRTRSRMPSSA